jgi:hypothetical protein
VTWKDYEGRYHLTERGQLAVNLLKTFPERVPMENRRPSALKIAVCVQMILVGILFLINPVPTGLHPVVTTSSAQASYQAPN